MSKQSEELEKAKTTRLNDEEDYEEAEDWPFLIEAIRSKDFQENIKLYLMNKREADKEKHQSNLKQIEERSKNNVIYWIIVVILILSIVGLIFFNKIDTQTGGTLLGSIIGYVLGRLHQR